MGKRPLDRVPDGFVVARGGTQVQDEDLAQPVEVTDEHWFVEAVIRSELLELGFRESGGPDGSRRGQGCTAVCPGEKRFVQCSFDRSAGDEARDRKHE